MSPNPRDLAPKGTEVARSDAAHEKVRAEFLRQLQMVADLRAASAPSGEQIWNSHEELLMGMAGEPVVLDSLTLPQGVRRGPVKACYDNAFHLASTRSDLVYTEGFAWAGFFPVNHAWCVQKETGQVVDPTWVSLDYEGPFVYLGLPFAHEFLAVLLCEEERLPTVFESDWTRQVKTLRCGLLFGKDGLISAWGDPPPF